MDAEIPTPQNEQPVQVPSSVSQGEMPQEKKTGLLKTFALLKLSPIEVLFVAIVIILLFGILNYFNILPISQIWPNQLGFLPHGLSQNKIPSKPNSQLMPTPSLNYSPNVFQYDTEKAKTILTQYIKDTLKPELIPQTLDIKQGLSIDNRQEDIKYQFSIYLVRNQENISVNFHYKERTNIPNNFTIFIQPSKSEQKTLTLTLANSLISSYFISPYSPIENCETKGTTSYCEIFKIENDGKRGFGVVIAQDPSKSPSSLTSIVFTCFIPKESKDYATQKSCISP